MASNHKKHGRVPRIKGRKVVEAAPVRHHVVQSAVLERCICGELKTDPVHIRARAKKPEPPVLVQVGITPDTEDARGTVRALLHWTFVEQIQEGVWNVGMVRPWPINVNFDASITMPDGVEIQVNLEWP